MDLYKLAYGGKTLTKDSSEFHVALVCYETPEKFCHRHLVSKWLQDNNIDCAEWIDCNGK